MLTNVKASYFMKVIFGYLDEKKKLKVAKYNKSIKNILDLSLMHYRLFSTRYIIYEANGNGKEYNKNDKLIYEGEYLNGERNGKGKKYYFMGYFIEFEGEYLNGKRNDKGKEYDDFSGYLKYDCEYSDDKRNGKGKEYERNGKLIFEAE